VKRALAAMLATLGLLGLTGCFDEPGRGDFGVHTRPASWGDSRVRTTRIANDLLLARCRGWGEARIRATRIAGDLLLVRCR
jgi:hypothetical protein